jgi:hypothetical protein
LLSSGVKRGRGGDSQGQGGSLDNGR